MKNFNFFASCHEHFVFDQCFIEETASGNLFTYGDLDRQSADIAHHLTQDLKLEKGQRVMVQVEKSATALIFYFACLRAGLIYLPLNTAYQKDELAYFFANARPSLILCDPSSSGLFSDLAGSKCIIETLDKSGSYSRTDSSGEATEQTFEPVVSNEDDVAVILYTSGTTGKPKGAMITHGNLIANTRSLGSVWGWQTSDVLLHALPIFHIHGLFVATHLALFHGSRIIFLPGFKPAEVASHLPRSSVFMGVPTYYVRLLEEPAFNKKNTRNMRLFTSGSAPLLSQTHEAVESKTGHQIVERYGMTETGMNTSNPITGIRKPGTVGTPLPDVEIKLDHASESPLSNELSSGKGVEMPLERPSELLVRGPNVFKGYWEMPDKTQSSFTVDGYFRTGDLVLVDDDGYVSIVGRDKDMIISGGLNVYPKEIELIIDNLPGVLESAVIGIPHKDFGEAVTAVIVPENNASGQSLEEAAVIVTLKNRIAGFKVPKRIYFQPQLPRNTMGKVQKSLLREQYSAPDLTR